MNDLLIAHFLHTRLLPLAIVAHVVIIFIRVRKASVSDRMMRQLSAIMLGLVVVQAGLGMGIIWHIRPPTLTTLHQTNGALLLVAAVLFVHAARLRLGEKGTQLEKGVEALA
jgi:cytochrome c oxidase assembly protein subunit 15